MTKKMPTIILITGILIALVVSIASFNILKNKAQKQAENQEIIQIAVAAVDLPWGTTLNSQMVKAAPYLRKSLPAGYQTGMSSVEGRVLIYPVKANEPIFESSLAPTSSKTGGMAAVVKVNKRAMAVKVDKVVGVSGFIFPGNRVDVLVTLQEKGENRAAITKTVLENVLVLATGSDVEKTGKQEKPAQVDVITLEVTPEEGERLALSATEGKLQLALRNYGDAAEVTTRGTTIPVLLSAYRSLNTAQQRYTSQRAVLKKSPAVVEPAFSVELIQGNKVTSHKFAKGD